MGSTRTGGYERWKTPAIGVVLCTTAFQPLLSASSKRRKSLPGSLSSLDNEPTQATPNGRRLADILLQATMQSSQQLANNQPSPAEDHLTIHLEHGDRIQGFSSRDARRSLRNTILLAHEIDARCREKNPIRYSYLQDTWNVGGRDSQGCSEIQPRLDAAKVQWTDSSAF
ncbi:hypothetical protein PINS_up011949 [Pythium insidiosum]|nr:hypothetical protein PINS_up011949 [Pythium insidiosum]